MSKNIGRNAPCPCGSTIKYKNCCKGVVPWEELLSSNSPEIASHLTNRGKNMMFLSAVADILELDIPSGPNWQDVKNACTPDAVRSIHELIPLIWPSEDDLSRILATHKNRCNSLYVGQYEPQLLFRGVTRHSIYADHILLFDPFPDHRRIAKKYNPIEHPNEYIFQTLKNLHMWLSLAPWIDAGLLSFIRSPVNYDYRLFRESLELQEAEVRDNPELQEALDRAPTEQPEMMELYQKTMLFLMPEPLLAQSFRKFRPGATAEETEAFLEEFGRRREAHPYVVTAGVDWKTEGRSEHMVSSSGECQIVARLTANLCNASLVTDIPFRWKQMQFDREKGGPVARTWEPLAKAFSGVELEVLNHVPLPAALTLHNEGHLSSMRVFMRKIFRASSSPDEYDDANVQTLADELKHEIAVAREEWQTIEKNLKRGLLGTATAGIGSGIALANPTLVIATAAATAAIDSIAAWYLKHNISHRLPASFFLKLEDDVYDGGLFGL